MKTFASFIFVGLVLSHALTFAQPGNPKPELKISIEVMDRELLSIVDTSKRPSIIADELDWCEGPIWVEKHKMLLFSDVPKNIVYKWTAAKGKEVYLTPSGYTGNIPRGGEMGSNGLGIDNQGRLVLCQDGDRKVSIMNAPLDKPAPRYSALTDGYKGKKFDSPNDLTFHPNGDIYFTDPPYGLEKNVRDPLKEAPYQGVYRIPAKGELVLLTDTITRPNGIALFPGGKSLLIANSDGAKPYWYRYDLDAKGNLTNGRIFYNAATAAKTARGMPDGLKISKRGYVFASGPGGLWIFNEKGTALGRIKANVLISNCSLSGDEKTVFMTADMYVLKMELGK